MRSSMAKILAAISFAALSALCVIPAHAGTSSGTDFAVGYLLGVPTGGTQNAIGVMLHQSVQSAQYSDEQETRELSPQEAQTQAAADRLAMRALVWSMMAFGAVVLVVLIRIARQ